MINKKLLLKIFIDKDMSQAKLAKLMGKSPTTINYWFNNKVSPSTQDVSTMCKILEIEDDELKSKIFLSETS